MTLNEFRKSTEKNTPPLSKSPLLTALWHDAKGDWSSAHNLAQEVETKDGSWVHAYLHRKEGDNSNAAYWYHKAGKKMPDYSLDEEWESIVQHFLEHE